MSKPLLLTTALALVAAGWTSAASAQDAVEQRGKEVFDLWCEACHGDGPGRPGTAALEVLYQGQKTALIEERDDLLPELTRTFVREGISVMPFFRKTEISDADLDALAAYLAP